jgi:hypothetical protein
MSSFEDDILADIENLDLIDELDFVEKNMDDGIEADDIDDSP